ncbi:MAG: hypothetical protein E7665_09060 [Ruminococcaceae bacterium]|nr:hypothetical protein [Oscillospiraceae bacterium]
MKNIVRALSLVLMLCMVVSLAACGDTSDPQNTGSQNTATSAPSTTGVATEEEKEELEIPADANYATDGNPYEFRILGIDKTNGYPHIDLDADEILNEPINDAVYERNNKVEELLGIKIVASYKTVSEIYSTAKSNISTNTDAFDLYCPPMNLAVNLALEGYLMDLYDVPYLDLEKSWWDQNVNDSLAIKNKLYFTTGEITVLDDDLCYAILMNKDALVNFGTDEDPYELVKQKKWTLAKLLEIIKDTNNDTNGDGKMTHDDDWGMMLFTNTSTVLYLASGESIVRPDGNGGFEFGMQDTRASDVISDVLDFMLDNQFYRTDQLGTTSADELQKFMSGHCMFRSTVFSVARQLRQMEMNFGILPNPLYDENQERYYTPTSSNGYLPGICVPVCAEDAERTGIITETLAYYSHVYLTPAYYDVALDGVLLRDNESREMLDILFGSKVYDIGYIYNFGNAAFVMNELTKGNNKGYVSKLESLEGPVSSGIADAMEKFEF